MFFGEALSTFEIAHRGYHDVQEVARLEHEHVDQLNALAEASVRINATMTTEETLQLTVEAAREVLGARHATISSTRRRPVRARDQRRVADRRDGRRRDSARRSA